MSTYPCLIGIIDKNNTIRSIYCHCDGNVENMAPLLIENYETKEKVDTLLELGNIFALGKHVNPTLKTHTFMNPEKDVVLAYHRDFNGELVPAKTYNNRKDMMEQWYGLTYLFDTKKTRWLHAPTKRFHPLINDYNKLKQT